MKDSTPDPKRQIILKSAWTTFATYGFRKTSMDDIARAAGMSRPALYLHYRNKEDIFRSLVQGHYDQTALAVEQALSSPGSVADVLATAFETQGAGVAEVMFSSPHGMELLDSGMTNSADIVRAGESRLADVYASWLADRAGTGQVVFEGSPEAIAGTITAALKGIKTTATDHATYLARIRQLAALVGAGLALR